MNIGIFGGTFNPVHSGHILLAQYCKQELNLDKVSIVPAFTPPHKESSQLVSCEHRLNMCKLAFDRFDGYEVSDIEILRQGRSYTYQTIIELKSIYPNDDLFLIVGADMFLTLDKWKNPEVIFKNASLVAVPRNGKDKEELSNYYENVLRRLGAKAKILTNPVMQISSTYIRENVYNDDFNKESLPRTVYEYIVDNNLYRK